MSARGTEVVIVGGGILGCTVAYYLTELGVTPTIVEATGIGSAASGLALGGLDPTGGAGIPGPVASLALESLRLHGDLHASVKEETGLDSSFHLLSHLTVALAEEEVPPLYDRMEWQRQQGFPARWLDAGEVLALEPNLSPDVVGALQTDDVGMMDCEHHMTTLAAVLRARGVRVQHATLQRIEWVGDRVAGVRLSTGSLSCDRLVLALGPWSGMLTDLLGVPVPIEPLKGQILRLRLPGADPSNYVSRLGMYVAAKRDGLVWAGTTEERVGFDTRTTAEARDHILRSACRIRPDLAAAEIVRHTACLRPLAADSLPVLGPVPGREGVFLATGAGRKGIELSTGMGRSVAELMVHGASSIPVDALSPARFLP